MMFGTAIVQAASRVTAWMHTLLLICSGLACAALFSSGVDRGEFWQVALSTGLFGFVIAIVYTFRIKPRLSAHKLAREATGSGHLALALAAVAVFPYGPADRREMREEGAGVLHVCGSGVRIVGLHGETHMELDADQVASVNSVRFVPLPGQAKAARTTDTRGRVWDAYLVGGGLGLFFPPKDAQVEAASLAVGSALTPREGEGASSSMPTTS